MPGLEDAIAAGQDEAIPTPDAPKGLEIPVPNGFEAPEDKSGASFDVLATVKMEDGKLTLEAIDGLPVIAQAEAAEDAEMESDMVGDAEGEGFMGAIERSMTDAPA